MIMSEEAEASFLEQFTIPPDRWHEAPDNVRKEAELATAEMIPAAIGYHESRGWFILHSGQGPYIAWCEKH